MTAAAGRHRRTHATHTVYTTMRRVCVSPTQVCVWGQGVWTRLCSLQGPGLDDKNKKKSGRRRSIHFLSKTTDDDDDDDDQLCL